MKPVFQALVAIIVIFAIGALVVSFSIDGIVKSNLESTTSEMLDTSVEVNDVGISILDGSGTIDGFIIHNPQGFSDNPALKLQRISMEMNLRSLLSDTVVIKNVEIQKPEVFFEQKTSGSNLDALSEKLDDTSSSDINMVVEYFLMEEGLVTLSTDIGGEKSMSGKFDRFELTDIGRTGNNTMDQVLQQILEPVLKRAAREAVKQGLMDAAKEKLEDLLEN